MRENDIFKALEIHEKRKIYGKECCVDCPYHKYDGDCYSTLINDVKIVMKQSMNNSAKGNTYENGYRQGMEALWKFLDKVVNGNEEEQRLSSDQMRRCFGHVYLSDVFSSYSPFEAMEKYDQFVKNKIKPGMIVVNHKGQRVAVMHVDGDMFSGYGKHGPFENRYIDEFVPTGETFDVNSFFEKLI